MEVIIIESGGNVVDDEEDISREDPLRGRSCTAAFRSAILNGTQLLSEDVDVVFDFVETV